MRFRQASYPQPLIFELRGREDETVENPLPPSLARGELNIPNLEESEVVRHYTRLSQMNYGIDCGFYPLGSCTMKYNPKIMQRLAKSERVRSIHPYQKGDTVQGALQVMYELQQMLCEIGGVDAVTLQPSAGAHGELTGMLITKAYHADRGERRTEVVLPDTAHGTNPASAAMAGFDVIEIPSKNGCVDLDALRSSVGRSTAAFMLTNPNTLGIFEKDVLRIADIVHEAGALLYYDGANLNAIMGKTTPGKMNFDIVHFNLHKTFATPHGGGGPGAGPIGVKKELRDFLPVPIVSFDGKRYYLDYDLQKSIGKVRCFYGNFAVLVKAHAYIKLLGGNGLKKAAERAVLNSNYLRARVEQVLDVPFPGLRKHEFVASALKLRKKGLRALDLCKRLMDYGFHPPTAYFPQIVEEALMIEPTETESKETLDAFANAIESIMNEDIELLKAAPHNAAVKRVDEVKAARDAILSWKMMLRK